MAKPTRMLSVVTSVAILLIGYLPAAFGHEVSLSCPVAFGQIPDASGLIAYYPLDGNTADVTGNGMDAIEVNAITPAEGKVGKGYSFNGKDSFIRLPPDISPYVYPQITITAWIKPKDLKGPRYIVNQGDHGNRNLFVSSGAVSAGTALVGSPKHKIYEDRWTFVALTYDQVTGTAVLLSGSTFSAVDGVTIPDQPRPSVLLGAKAPGNSVFDGVLDDVRIYNRALTTTELAGLKTESQTIGPFNSNSAPSLPGLNTMVSDPGTMNIAGNDAIAYPQTDVFVRPGTDDAQLTGSAPQIAEGPPAMDAASPYLDQGPPPTGGRLAESTGLAEDQLVGIDAAAVTKSIDNVAPTPGETATVAPTLANAPVDETESLPVGQSTYQPGQPLFDENPTQLPGDQFERPSAEDIPTIPEYQVADQNVEYVAEGTMLVPAQDINAVMDLQKIRIWEQRENKGDEYYLVIYKLRGFRGQGDRVFTFDSSKQIWPIVAGSNWAKKGTEFSIPQAAGKLTFNKLKPFEVYGFVAVVMEANKNSEKELTNAFGFGEFQNELGVTEVVSGAFARAVPTDTGLPDYGDTSCPNVVRIVRDNHLGAYTHFGYPGDNTGNGFITAIRDAITAPLKRRSPDSFEGAIWGFYMNVPGGASCFSRGWPSSRVFPPPGYVVDYQTLRTKTIVEHRQYE